MNRRDAVLSLAALGVVGSPLASFAQQPGKVWRVGYLATVSGPDEAVDALREQLRKLGYIEGRNIDYEYRWAAGREERVQDLADELVRLKVDVIVTRTTIVAAAAKRATGNIPIVMASAANPVGGGVIASLARPGGNVTGVTQNTTETDGKRLEILHEIIPKATRFASLIGDKTLYKAGFAEQARAAAKKLGLTLIHQEVGTPDGIKAAFAAMKRQRAQALVVATGPFITSQSKLIANLAAAQRLPVIYNTGINADAGGLMFYGASPVEMHRKAAAYVDRILKGAKPANLPVEEPTKYELVVNLNAAKALGITIPRSVLARADEIIQ
jgi:putative ABC transport system substrate-binding protein